MRSVVGIPGLQAGEDVNPLINLTRKLYNATAERFLAIDGRHEQSAKDTIWEPGAAFVAPSVVNSPRRGFLELRWAAPLLRMSLGIRFGEIRIGFIIQSYPGVDAVEIARQLSASAIVPSYTQQMAPEKVFADYVFQDRFADPRWLVAAMKGDDDAVSMLADAIFLEAHHLRTGLMRFMAGARVLEKAAVQTEQSTAKQAEVEKIVDTQNLIPLELESIWDRAQVAEVCGIAQERVRYIGEGDFGNRYIILVPQSRIFDIFSVLAMEQEKLFVLT
jgi:hypothetical protein